jgi:hypothetical protein
MYDLTDAEHNQIIGLFKGGATRQKIVKMFGFFKTAVY